MSDRTAMPRDPRPTRRRPNLATARGRRLRPAVESLEGRALMSYGGSPDFTFGKYGFAANNAPGFMIGDFMPLTISSQPNGQFLEAGSFLTLNTAAKEIYGLVVARFNADGTPDATFGNGGYFTDPALTAVVGSNMALNYTNLAQGLAIQPDGGIVAVGENQLTTIALRLTAAGTLDPGFGTGGIATLGSANFGDGKLHQAKTAAILPDGQIAVQGVLYPDTTTRSPAVELLNADGSVATGFGTNGLAVVPLPAGASGFVPIINFNNDFALTTVAGIVAQADGKIVVDANATPTGANPQGSYEIVSTRFDADGKPDATYGTAGQAVITAQAFTPDGTGLDATTLTIQPDGKLIIGGGAKFALGTGSYSIYTTVLRLDPDGRLDPTFGIGGGDILLNAVGPNTSVTSLAIAPNGQIVLAGYYGTFGRLDSNGLPDPTFGEGGTIFTFNPLSPSEATVIGISVLTNGEIVGLLNTYPGGPGLVRLLVKGAPSDYLETGVSDPAILLTTYSVLAAQDPTGKTAGVFSQFGSYGAGDTMPAPGDYNGGGVDEIGVYLPLLGAFAYRPYGGVNQGDQIIPFGTPGYGKDYPAEGDYDHSGRTELAVYSTAQGAFIYRPGSLFTTGNADVTVPFGVAGVGQSIPAPADYFNTGQTDFAVYLVKQGAYEIRNPVTGQDYTIPFGTPGAGETIPVPGDYDGSGHTELAVYLPASGALIYRPANGGPDVTVAAGKPGYDATLPMPGDYDGSGHTEFGGFDPVTATFSYLPAKGGPAVSEQFGIPGAESVPFSLATDAVAESGNMGGGSGAPTVHAASVSASAQIPLTPDVLDALAGTVPKKKAGKA